MKTAIIIHGTPSEEEYFNPANDSESNDHWLPWLQQQLLVNHIFTQTPEMPDAYKPDYDKWKREFERFDVDENTTLIGHSCGAGFLIRWLSENKVRGDKLILVAPWMDPDRRKTTNFFEFEIDPTISDRFNEIHLFVSTDDDEDVLVSTDQIQKALPNITMHEFTDKGHFCYSDMKTHKFPELLETVFSK